MNFTKQFIPVTRSQTREITIKSFGWGGHRKGFEEPVLEGMVNRMIGRGRRTQIDNIAINGLWKYEKEGWKEGRVENA